jgi:hypothetical protein
MQVEAQGNTVLGKTPPAQRCIGETDLELMPVPLATHHPEETAHLACNTLLKRLQ